MIRILLVDDNLEFLEAVARFLAADPLTEVIGQAPTGKEALNQAPQLKPDLVLMDLALPEMNGLETTRKMKAQPGAPKVIIVTLYDNAEYRAAAHSVHADGFISKSELGVQLLPLVHTLFTEDPQAVRPANLQDRKID